MSRIKKPAIKARNVVERGMSTERILEYRRGCRLRDALTDTMPKAVIDHLSRQCGTYLGDFTEVVRFALTDWIHHNADKLPRKPEL